MLLVQVMAATSLRRRHLRLIVVMVLVIAVRLVIMSAMIDEVVVGSVLLVITVHWSQFAQIVVVEAFTRIVTLLLTLIKATASRGST